MIPVFVRLLKSPHIEIIEQVIWGLGNIAGDSTYHRDLVIDSGAVALISDLLDNCKIGTSFCRNASWALSNLCRGRPAANSFMIARAIPSLCKILLQSNSPEVITDICWALSYFTDGGPNNIPLITNNKLLPRIVQLLEHPHVDI